MEKLDAIFRTNLYVTERTDTSMGIHRKDPQDDRQKKGHDKKDAEEEFGEDRTILSVSALHGFLNSLLQQAGQAPAPAPSEIPASPPASQPPLPAGAQAGYRAAASAYQSTAQSGTPGTIRLNDPPPAESGASIALSAEELRAIDRLLHDVETLARNGIDTITLTPAETFLQSLSLGVSEALETLSSPA